MMIDNEVIFNVRSSLSGEIGIILLNRPKALNALSLAMCEAIDYQLKKWEHDKTIQAVIIKSDDKRAFCAGGDIRKLYELGIERYREALQFFVNEYQLNQTLFHFSKPYIAVLNGITMGGGVGISVHGSHRIATPDLIFAMPETGIGFYPDIGASYFLSKLPEPMGLYFGLTGARLDVNDALYLSLIHGVIGQEKIDKFFQDIYQTDLSTKPHEKISKLIDEFHIDKKTSLNTSRVEKDYPLIKKYFGKESVESIFDALEKSEEQWAQSTLKQLKQKSPTSLKVTFETIRRGKEMSFDECMAMELHVSQQFLKTPDFYEGVRAAVIDKDQSPKWQPSDLASVDQEQISSFF